MRSKLLVKQERSSEFLGLQNYSNNTYEGFDVGVGVGTGVGSGVESQTVWPVLRAHWPDGHVTQLDAPLLAPYLPVSKLVQLDGAVLLLYFPAAQSEQLTAPLPE
jgi:hypothetical protein